MKQKDLEKQQQSFFKRLFGGESAKQVTVALRKENIVEMEETKN